MKRADGRERRVDIQSIRRRRAKRSEDVRTSASARWYAASLRARYAITTASASSLALLSRRCLAATTTRGGGAGRGGTSFISRGRRSSRSRRVRFDAARRDETRAHPAARRSRSLAPRAPPRGAPGGRRRAP
eukprot:30930-Pelagococcus_subviridis.AAC.9